MFTVVPKLTTYEPIEIDYSNRKDIFIQKKFEGRCLNCNHVTIKKHLVDCPNCSHALRWSAVKKYEFEK